MDGLISTYESKYDITPPSLPHLNGALDGSRRNGVSVTMKFAQLVMPGLWEKCGEL